jgi:hypothetical protein
MQNAEDRAYAVEKRLDKRMDAISKLIQQSMRILVRTEAKLKALTRTQEELARAQMETKKTLRAFINSLRHGGNGR